MTKTTKVDKRFQAASMGFWYSSRSLKTRHFNKHLNCLVSVTFLFSFYSLKHRWAVNSAFMFLRGQFGRRRFNREHRRREGKPTVVLTLGQIYCTEPITKQMKYQASFYTTFNKYMRLIYANAALYHGSERAVLQSFKFLPRQKITLGLVNLYKRSTCATETTRKIRENK